MRRAVWFSFLGVLLGCSVLVNAQERQLCDPAEDSCVEDEFSIGIDEAGGQFEYEIADFVADMEFNITVSTDTKTEKVQGWSYGVAHDEAIMSATNATTEGTDAGNLIDSGFDATSAEDIETCVRGKGDCSKDDATSREDGGGWISAVVLNFLGQVEMPLGVSTIAKATYTLKVDPGAKPGASIRLSDELAKKNSPPAAVNLTVDGKSRLWTKATDGMVYTESECTPETEGPPGDATCSDGIDNDCDELVDLDDPDCQEGPVPENTPERCNNEIDDDQDGDIDCADSDCADVAVEGPPGDATCSDGIDNDCDGDIDAADAGCDAGPVDCVAEDALYFGATVTDAAVPLTVISSRNEKAILGFQMGVKKTGSAGSFQWEFSDELGTLNQGVPVPVETILTDEGGLSITPTKGNTATSADDQVVVLRGSAVEGFSDDDFFAVTYDPDVGGEGFTVGYVADLTGVAGHTIPVTPSGDLNPCPTNELLKIEIGGPVPISRGDADANGKINVSDAIWIIQVIVGNFQPAVACEDVLDANDDGTLNISDAIPVLAYVFQRGAPLPAPFLVCEPDTTASDLTCTESNCQ